MAAQTFSSTLPHKLAIAAVMFCMITVPFTWVFTHPWTSESVVMITLAALVPVALFLLSFRMQRIEISEEKIYNYGLLGLKSFPGLDIPSIKAIESHRSMRGQTLTIKLSDDTETSLSVQFLSLDRLVELLWVLRGANSSIQMPHDLEPIISAERTARAVLIKDFEKQESGQALKLIFGAAVIVVAIALFKFFTGDEISMKELADMFVSILN